MRLALLAGVLYLLPRVGSAAGGARTNQKDPFALTHIPYLVLARTKLHLALTPTTNVIDYRALHATLATATDTEIRRHFVPQDYVYKPQRNQRRTRQTCVHCSAHEAVYQTPKWRIADYRAHLQQCSLRMQDSIIEQVCFGLPPMLRNLPFAGSNGHNTPARRYGYAR